MECFFLFPRHLGATVKLLFWQDVNRKFTLLHDTNINIKVREENRLPRHTRTTLWENGVSKDSRKKVTLMWQAFFTATFPTIPSTIFLSWVQTWAEYFVGDLQLPMQYVSWDKLKNENSKETIRKRQQKCLGNLSLRKEDLQNLSPTRDIEDKWRKGERQQNPTSYVTRWKNSYHRDKEMVITLKKSNNNKKQGHVESNDHSRSEITWHR